MTYVTAYELYTAFLFKYDGRNIGSPTTSDCSRVESDDWAARVSITSCSSKSSDDFIVVVGVSASTVPGNEIGSTFY